MRQKKEKNYRTPAHTFLLKIHHQPFCHKIISTADQQWNRWSLLAHQRSLHTTHKAPKNHKKGKVKALSPFLSFPRKEGESSATSPHNNIQNHSPSQSEIRTRQDAGLPRAVVTVATMNSCEHTWTGNAIFVDEEILTMETIDGCGSTSKYTTAINWDRRKMNTQHNNQSGLVKSLILKS